MSRTGPHRMALTLSGEMPRPGIVRLVRVHPLIPRPGIVALVGCRPAVRNPAMSRAHPQPVLVVQQLVRNHHARRVKIRFG